MVTHSRVADRVVISDLRAVGVHGILPEEKRRAQPFRIDLEIGADLVLAGRSDSLADTIDYSEVSRLVVSIVEENSFELLERLAQVIADTILAYPVAKWVAVSVTKLHPPLDVDVASVGVHIERPVS